MIASPHRREGEAEAKLARDRELQAVALHAEESARMRQEADELKAEILRLKRIIENLEMQIPAKAEIESKASEEWQLRQRIKVQNNKIVELQAERDGLKTDRDEKLRSLKLLMDHKEAIEDQLETYKKRSVPCNPHCTLSPRGLNRPCCSQGLDPALVSKSKGKQRGPEGLGPALVSKSKGKQRGPEGLGLALVSKSKGKQRGPVRPRPLTCFLLLLPCPTGRTNSCQRSGICRMKRRGTWAS